MITSQNDLSADFFLCVTQKKLRFFVGLAVSFYQIEMEHDKLKQMRKQSYTETCSDVKIFLMKALKAALLPNKEIDMESLLGRIGNSNSAICNIHFSRYCQMATTLARASQPCLLETFCCDETSIVLRVDMTLHRGVLRNANSASAP